MNIAVIMTCRIAEADREAFESAYLKVTEAVRGTPGHLRDELMRESEDGGAYILLAEWSSRELFLAWADDPEHIQQSAPMFPYWVDSFERKIYDVRATLEEYSRVSS